MSDAERIESIGRALYGRHWMGQLASDLDVSDRTFRRWVNDDREVVPDGVWADLARLMQERRDQIDAILRDVVAIPCHKRGSHDTQPAPGASGVSPDGSPLF